MEISGDCFATSRARYGVTFVGMGNDSFSFAISGSVFLDHQALNVSQFIERARACRMIVLLSGVCPSSKIVHMDDVIKPAFANAFNERVKDSPYACGRVVWTGHIEWFAILAERKCFRR